METRNIIKIVAQSIDTSAKSDLFTAAGFIAMLPALLAAKDNGVRIWASIAVRNLAVGSSARLNLLIEASIGTVYLLAPHRVPPRSR